MFGGRPSYRRRMTIFSIETRVEAGERGPGGDASWVYQWAANRLRFERWLWAAEGYVDPSVGAAEEAAQPISA